MQYNARHGMKTSFQNCTFSHFEFGVCPVKEKHKHEEKKTKHLLHIIIQVM